MKDIITGRESQYEPLLTLKDFPIRMMEQSGEALNDKRMDMTFVISTDSGVISIKNTPSAEDIYADAHANLSGAIWKMHHQKIAEMVKKKSPSRVLEIGGSTGYLESECARIGAYKDKWYIVEPAPNPIEKTTAFFIKGFYPEAVPRDTNFDLVIHTHVMEHLLNPRKFLLDIAANMGMGKQMIFSVPNLKLWYEKCNTSVLNFEHFYLLTEDYIDYLLNEFGFEIELKEYFMEHSIIYQVKKQCGGGMSRIDFMKCYTENKSLFTKWEDYHISKVIEWNNAVKRHKNDGVFLFGAHITSQFLIAFGLDKELIMGLIDNDVTKKKRRVSGMDTPIFTPDVFLKIKQPIFIIPPNPYISEIKNQVYSINKDIIILE